MTKTVNDIAELYGIPYWGGDYFHIAADGNLHLSLNGYNVAFLDIVESLKASGHSLPVILRFPQILEDRLDIINRAFQTAISKFGYKNHYQGVFPIKVNQRRVVIETLANYGQTYNTGLEAGSKAELMVCLAQDISSEALLCCNGFKDDEFISLALWGRKLGKKVVIILEKCTELERILRLSKKMSVKPLIGIRLKLHSKGSGRWEASSGDSAKFGLSATEIINVLGKLESLDLLDSLVLLHCHLGSQLTDIRKIRVAIREAAQVYAMLYKMGAKITYLDVGGGLAVDYDGSKTTFYASANYSVQEYAETIVYELSEVCTKVKVDPPVIVSESGRFLAAYHSIIVLPVIDAIGLTLKQIDLPPLEGKEHNLISDLRDLLEGVNLKTYRDVYYEAMGNKDTMHNLFDLGYMTLLERAHVESLCNSILAKVARIIKDLDYVPEELGHLKTALADKYICNFSLFQSLPDHWAIGSLFPIMPLHRLNEFPTREATLVDISCDSDGKINRFVDLRDVARTLRLHPLNENPYYLGVFLTGAYQDVLSSTHNLLGKVSEAHIRLTGNGSWQIERFINGQKAYRVIESMGYQANELSGNLANFIDGVRDESTLTGGQAETLKKTYNDELLGYTYLEDI